MAFIILCVFLKKFEKIENFNFETDVTERGFKESLSIALGYFQFDQILK